MLLIRTVGQHNLRTGYTAEIINTVFLNLTKITAYYILPQLISFQNFVFQEFLRLK